MLITATTTESHARLHAGGKGYNLYLLTRHGFPVPEWVILGADLFDTLRRDSGLEGEIRKILSETTEAKRLAAAIRQRILEAPLPPSVEALIRTALARFSGRTIAVRSSGLDEDSARFSFAGQLSSFLFVDSEQAAVTCVRECWASSYSERAICYRRQNQLDLSEHNRVAVILQEMIPSEKSGVMFTCDPVQRDSGKIVVNSVYGVGEGLVSGLFEGDTFVTDKASGEKVDEEVVHKPSRLVRSEGVAGVIPEEVPESSQYAASLDDNELGLLNDLGLRVEQYYGVPQDIEWAIAGGQVYLLQSRPVTTPVPASTGTLHIWDNSNIVESYGGITLPLTFTFARHVYHQVYLQFCELLMVPAREIRKFDSVLSNMLGSIDGRVYYNLLNWYKLTSILPGYKHNRGFMEVMMGTSHSLEAEVAERIRPPAFGSTIAGRIRKAITGLKFFYYHLVIQRMVDRFLKYFHAVYDDFRHRDYSRLPANTIYAAYQELESRLLFDWHAPIVNDYLCMVYFGLLKKLSGLWLGDDANAIRNDLLCGVGSLESAEPTRELMSMAKAAHESPDLERLILETPAHSCLEALNQSPFRQFFERVQRYIDRYGYRCMSEMKLEQKDLHQDPTFLFVVLKNYLRSGQFGSEERDARDQALRTAAEANVKQKLTGLRRWTFFWSLRNARRAVANRENTRFCRTRVYGVIRAMLFGIGNHYAARNLIDRPEDLFYLTLDELRGSLEGHLTVQDLRQLVAMRKESYRQYGERDPPPRIVTRGPVYSSRNDEWNASPEQASDVEEGCLAGIGCSPGIVEGTIKVVISADDDIQLDGQVLATTRTDPGWIPLYPSLSGLLVERGGLLSHSAIVAREMGLPTIVGVKGLLASVRDGDRVRMDGTTGVIELLPNSEPRTHETIAEAFV